MEIKLPIENPNLPADHQDAGNEPLPRGETPGTVNFGQPKLPKLPKHSPAPIPGVKMASPGRSPTQKQLSGTPGGFAHAVTQMKLGQRLTKGEWKNSDWYCQLRDAKLMIHRPDGTWHDWIIQEGDLLGEDWISI